MKRPGALLLAAGPALALVLAACSSGGAANSPQTGSGSGSSPAGPVNRTFTYDTTAPVMDDGWDPATEYSDGVIAMSNMYETLTRYDPATHKVRPLLATSWTSSKNGLTWTFQLRQGVKFHTGAPLTAQAAKSAIERTIKLAGGAAYVWDAVKSISTPDAGTLVFRLKYPSPLDLQASADYSAYIYDTKAAGGGSLAKWLNTPHDAGTGPYTVQSWNKGQEFEVTQTQFPGYWGGWQGSHFTKVVFRVVPQDTTAVQLLRSGQVSFVEQMAPALWESLRGAPGIKLVSADSWQNLLGQLNAKTLSLPQRQAILYGINYNGIVAALKGAATLSSGLVPDGLFGHFASSSLPNYSYDPKKAASILNSIGYGPGKKPLNLSLTYTQGDSNEQVVATLMKSSLAKLNINLSVQSLAWPTQWGKAKSANAAQHQDIFFEYWWPDYADPYSWFVNLLATEKQPYFNLSYYSNPALDKQINQVESLVATDRTAGQALYKSMQTTVLQQAPLTVLYEDTYQYAMSSGFTGFTANPAYPNVVFAYDLTPTGS
jgi:peptide/nickel transport system substrate-binding protein